MLSHVVEFSCQYSDQVRKKQKVWHDGKLRHYQINNRFLLYTTDDVLLSSVFVTSSKELKIYTDEDNFGIVEHNIFGRFVVIIEEIIGEYDREIRYIKTTSTATTSLGNSLNGINNRQDEIQSVDKKDSMAYDKSIDNVRHPPNKIILKGSMKNTISKGIIPSSSLHSISSITSNITPKNPSVKMTKIEIGKDRYETSGGLSTPNLALKVNKPFKPPRIISNVATANNRPSIRNSKVKKQTVGVNLIADNINKNKSGDNKNDKNIIQKSMTAMIPGRHLEQTKNIISKESSDTKKRNGQTDSNRRPLFKIRMINHTPIILP